MRTEQSGDRPRLVGLELLRFVSAIAILVWHYKHFGYVGTRRSEFSTSSLPFYPALRVFYEQGFYGVYVFWCLSGFIFFRKYARAIRDRTVGAKEFFVLRFSRLYPLHFLTLSLTAALQLLYHARVHDYFVYGTNDLRHFILQLFLATNWGYPTDWSFNAPIWSISVEVLIYAFFYVALRSRIRPALLATATAVGAALVMKLHLSLDPIVTCLLFFHLGGVLEEVHLRLQDDRFRFRLCGAFAALTFGSTAVLALNSSLPVRGKLFTYVGLVLTSSAVFLAGTPLRLPDRVARGLLLAGNLTYSSYLLHFPLQAAIALGFATAGRPIPLSHPGLFLGFLTLTLVLAGLCYRYVEMPLQGALRRRWLGQRPPDAVGGSP